MKGLRFGWAGGHVLVVGCCLLLALCPLRSFAQDGARQAALILRVLSYDRNLEDRVGDRVEVLVVYRSGNAASERERSQLVQAINGLGARTMVADRRAGAVDHAFRDGAELAQRIRAAHAAAVYVCGGLEAQVDDISRATRQSDVLSMTGSEAAVRRGLGVGFVDSGGRVQLFINLAAAQAEGARLDAAVLRLAEVIR